MWTRLGVPCVHVIPQLLAGGWCPSQETPWMQGGQVRALWWENDFNIFQSPTFKNSTAALVCHSLRGEGCRRHADCPVEVMESPNWDNTLCRTPVPTQIYHDLLWSICLCGNDPQNTQLCSWIIHLSPNLLPKKKEKKSNVAELTHRLIDPAHFPNTLSPHSPPTRDSLPVVPR